LIVSSLYNHVFPVDNFEVSIWFHSRNNIEWSLDIHAIFFVELSLGGFTLPFINIDDVPLLMDLSTLGLITLDVSSFSISGSLDIKVFTSLISDIGTISSEQLPPSGVS
jgi:hypothetical protein